MTENSTDSMNVSVLNSSDLSGTNKVIRMAPKLLPITSDLYFVVGILTVILNGAVIICFVLNPRQLLKDGYHTLGMSVSDTLAGLTVCTYFGAIGRYMSYELCAVANLAFVTSQCAVIIQLMVICTERFNVLRKVGSTMTTKKFQHPVVILAVWLFSTIMHVWPVFVYGIRRSDMTVCSFQVIFNQNFGKVGVYYAALYTVPLVIINLFYVFALIYLRQRFRKISQSPANSMNTVSNALPGVWLGMAAQKPGVSYKGKGPATSGCSSSAKGKCSKPTDGKHVSHGKHHSPDSSNADIAMDTLSVLTSANQGSNRGTHIRFKQTRKQMQQHVFITFGLLLLVLNIVSLPRFGLIFISKQSSEFLDNMRLAMASFNSLNSLFNPVIYAFRWTTLRIVVQDQWKIFQRFCHRRQT